MGEDVDFPWPDFTFGPN